MSRGLIRRLRTNGAILINGRPSRTSDRVAAGDELAVFLSARTEPGVKPEAVPIDVVYEDDHILVVNKPPGLVVHPTRGYPSGTLANGVAGHLAEQGLAPVVHPVSRLDRNTSGLLVFGKTPHAHDRLARQMAAGQMKRIYTAVAHGVPEGDEGAIDLPIRRDPDHPTRRMVAEDGQRAVTHYRVIRSWPGASRLSLSLETGRTHQIRVHLSHLGYTLFGDRLYGAPEDDDIGRQALHAGTLRLLHPRTAVPMEFDAPLPSDMAELLHRIAASSASRRPDEMNEGEKGDQ